ncbi:MAG: ABC transporter ATP-binding protein [Chloroflexota bacterium]
MSEPLLSIRDLSVEYPTRMGVVRAVEGLDLRVARGEVMGMVGESGCGKSTVGMAVLRLLRPPGRVANGEILFEDRDLLKLSHEQMRQLRGSRISMIFQDPMTCLNPLERISDHIVETIRTHQPQVSKVEARQQAERLIDRLGISTDRLDDYPHQLSGGMRQRVMIGLALALRADLIIADEPTTSLDVIVEAQFLDLLKELQREFGLTILLITHNIGVVAQLADRVAVMYAGELAEVGEVHALFAKPLHPYTQGLLHSVPNIQLADDKLQVMGGSPPDLIEPPSGCKFHPRCPFVMDRCRRDRPRLRQVEVGRQVACWLYE